VGTLSLIWFKSNQCPCLVIGDLCGYFCFGVIRGFYSPSATSLKPFLIPRELYTNGATWTTIGWQSGVILGPMLGGFMLAF
jgi:MFS family permease